MAETQPAVSHWNIIADDHARTIFGNHTGTIINSKTASGWGHYSNSSLGPVASFVDRPALHNAIKGQLHDTLYIRKHDAKILVVYGIGGAGKTQLVLDYVRTFRDDYTAVFWIEAGQKESLERDYLLIYSLLFDKCDSLNNEKDPAHQVVNAIQRWLQGRAGRWLFVLDGADSIFNPDDDSYIYLRRYLPQGPSVDIIITTRSSVAQGMTELLCPRVARMATEEAVALFIRRSELKNLMEKEAVSIVTEIGCLALTVSLAAAYVAATPRLRSNITQYLLEYQERRKILLSQNPTNYIQEYDESVVLTLETSLAAASKQAWAVPILLGLLAFLTPDDILPVLFKTEETQSSLQAGTTRLSDPTWRATLSPERYMDTCATEDALKTMKLYSLIQWREDQDSYDIHKLVRAWAYDRLERDEQNMFCIAVLRLLAKISALSSLHPPLKPRLVPHIMTSFKSVPELIKRPRIDNSEISKLLESPAMFLQSIGQLSALCLIQEFCFAYHAAFQGQEHLATLIRKGSLALTYYKQGRWEEAEELQLHVMVTFKKVLGLNRPDTLMSMRKIAMIYSRQERLKEAEELQEQVMQIMTKLLGTEHPGTLATIHDLASTYARQGRVEKAEELHVQVLETRMKVLGEEHPETLSSINNLAELYLRQGQFKKAEALHLQAFTTRSKVVGLEHPDMRSNINNLTSTYSSQGRFTDAGALLEQVIKAQFGVRHREHPMTLLNLNSLAKNHRRQGRYQAAEKLQMHTIRAMDRVLGRAHPITLTNVGDLAEIYHEQGRSKEAETLQGQVIEALEGVLGPDHRNTLINKARLAMMWNLQNRGNEALGLLKECLELQRQPQGRNDPLTACLLAKVNEWQSDAAALDI
ncbi:MAG: Kinesin light chain 3 [Claussenomyces sp. TS43310]|nr:MAG: Kinesin light chain 3 [Claussenomyces sp. TS43310]